MTETGAVRRSKVPEKCRFPWIGEIDGEVNNGVVMQEYLSGQQDKAH
jgi:hypothetical protein